MAKGEQIYVMRAWFGLSGLYEHHGIDTGDGSVIHYRKTGEAEIARTAIATFAGTQPIYTRQYAAAFIPDVVVERAESRLGERRYNLLANNCEHFATWCKTGQAESAQLLNYGLQPYPLLGGGLPTEVEAALQASYPVQAPTLYQEAIATLDTAQRRVQSRYDHAQTEATTWHRVAALAVRRDRDDLAKAALMRWHEAQSTLQDLQPQLDQLRTLQHRISQQRISSASV